ncbi:hypothetical protein ACEQ6A_34860, partial [Rhizobium brockwellii]
RLIYGARPTLLLLLVVVLLMAPLGIVFGILAGFFGGLTERLLMRVTDIVMSFPRLLLAFAFVAIMGPGLPGVGGPACQRQRQRAVDQAR